MTSVALNDVEQMIQAVQAMERREVIASLRTVPATFPIDFTDEFLEVQPLERLKHIALAVFLQVRKKRIAAVAA